MSFPDQAALAARHGRLAAPLAAAAAALLPGEGAAQPRFRLEAEAEQVASTNPFLIPGEDRTTLSFEMLARPEIDWTLAAGTSLAAGGEIGMRQYFRRYGDYLLGRADATLRHRRNEYLSFATTLSYARELPTDGLADSTDAAFDTLNARTTALASASATWNPDALMAVTGEVAWQRTSHSGSPILRSSTYNDVRIGISRRVSPLTSVGVAGHLSIGDAGPSGETTARGVQLTIDRRLSEAWRANARAGFERLTTRGGLDPIDGNGGGTNVTGSGTICYEPPRTALCLTAALGSAVSSISGLQRDLSFSGTVRHRLSERQTLSASAEYRRSTGSAFATPIDVLRTAGRYERRLSERLSLAGEVDYQRRTRFGGERIGAVFVRVGVIFRGIGR